MRLRATTASSENFRDKGERDQTQPVVDGDRKVFLVVGVSVRCAVVA